MQGQIHGFLAVLGVLLLAGAAAADEPVGKFTESELFGQLQALRIPFECHRLNDDGQVDSGDVSDAAEVDYIQFGQAASTRGDLPPLPEKLFDIFPRFPNLKAIRLESVWLDSEQLPRLKEISNLKSFSVHISSRELRRSFQVPADLDFLAELIELEELSLTSCDLTDDMIVKLLPLKSLKKLRLSWNYKLTHAVLPTLQKLPALESLNLLDTSFAPRPIEARRFAARLKSFLYSAPTVKHKETFSLEDFREIVTLPRHTWNYGHLTDVPLADITSLLPGPVTRFSSRWRNTLTLEGRDAQGEGYSFAIRRPLSDEDLETVGQMTELQALSIDAKMDDVKTIFTSNGLRRLTELGKLEDLTIVSSWPLTRDSLAAFSKMRSLRHVELRGIDFDAAALQWVRAAPRLEELTLTGGTVNGDALADLATARQLQSLTLGYQQPHGRDESVTIIPPTRPFTLDNIKRLTLVSSGLTVEQCQCLGNFRSLESVILTGPVTDAHLRCLASLQRLAQLTVKLSTKQVGANTETDGKITQRGIQALRVVETPIYLSLPTSPFTPLAQAVADQFGWRFYGCSSGCCDTVPMGGAEWTIEAGKLKRKPQSISHSDDRRVRTVRIRGPRQLERLVLDKHDLPPTVDTLCLTDCYLDELVLQGWLPESIRIWGNSHIGKLVVSGVAKDARTSLCYYFLDGRKTLTMPSSDRVVEVHVSECAALETLRLDGACPNLEVVRISECRNLTDEAKAAFRKQRPDVTLDEQTVHRPGA